MKKLKIRETKELKLANEIEKEGFLTFKIKSLMIVVCPKQRIVKFIRFRNKNPSKEEKKSLDRFKDLTDEYFCKFEVWSL
jgi:hypothetical protein